MYIFYYVFIFSLTLKKKILIKDISNNNYRLDKSLF